MKTKHVLAGLIILLFAVSICGCAMITANYTAKARYYQALKWYDDNLEAYNNFYDAASPATQEKLKKDFDPAFIAGDVALEIWEESLGSEAAGTAEDVWISRKNVILGLLKTYGVIEIKED